MEADSAARQSTGGRQICWQSHFRRVLDSLSWHSAVCKPRFLGGETGGPSDARELRLRREQGAPCPYTCGTQGKMRVEMTSGCLARSRDTFQDRVPPSMPRLPMEGLGLDDGGRFSGMSLGWLQPGPARANRRGLYTQTLSRSRCWTQKRPVRGEHCSLRTGH